MDTPNIKKDWSKKKELLKQKFDILSDDDLVYVEGQEKELIQRVKTRLGISYYETQKLFLALEMQVANAFS